MRGNKCKTTNTFTKSSRTILNFFVNEMRKQKFHVLEKESLNNWCTDFSTSLRRNQLKNQHFPASFVCKLDYLHCRIEVHINKAITWFISNHLNLKGFEFHISVKCSGPVTYHSSCYQWNWHKSIPFVGLTSFYKSMGAANLSLSMHFVTVVHQLLQ